MEFTEEIRKMVERHDKEIRDETIDEFCERSLERLTELSDNATICGVKNVDFLTLDTVIDEITDMEMRMKEVENEQTNIYQRCNNRHNRL